jgi:hypothetical protein
MSNEPKIASWRRPDWCSFAFLAFFLLCAYQGAHYATATIVNEPGFCAAICTHTIAGRRAPRWIDADFFWLAEGIDDLIGLNPWRG